MGRLPMIAMSPEVTRQERFIAYTALLRERFDAGMLEQLQGLPQWVVWRSELEGGKSKKVPYNPRYHLARASVKIPLSWETLDQALNALATGNYSGIGFMITPPLVFIDLDHSYDRSIEEITDPQAAAIVQSLNSYTEVSPSGTGLHILAYGQLPGKGIHTGIEMYDQDRFTTITTDHLEGTPTTINQRQEEVAAVYHHYAPVAAPPPPRTEHRGGSAGMQRLSELPPEAAGDTFLLSLLQGDTSAYQGDESRAEFVTLMKLMHYTGDDRAWTKAIFSSYPIGQRAKAREDTKEGRRGNSTYLEHTIDAVLRKRRNPPMQR